MNQKVKSVKPAQKERMCFVCAVVSPADLKTTYCLSNWRLSPVSHVREPGNMRSGSGGGRVLARVVLN